MLPHHEQAIERWADAMRADPEVLAVVVAGSLTKGFAGPGSDVDGFLVVTPDEFARRQASGDLTYFSVEHTDYEGGYVDAKYVDLAFVEAVAAHGSEPARSAFAGARVVWSRVDGLDGLVLRAASYPGDEDEREAKMARFLAQVQAMQWYVGEGVRRDDPYLAAWAASRLVLFGCRLVLAHNRILYPYHKWLLRTVAGAPEQPAGFADLARRLAATPTPALAEEFVLALVLFREWPEAPGGWQAQFVRDSEWNWLDGPPPVDDV